VSDDHPVEGLPTPDPSHDPDDVVSILLSALATNDDPHEDAGIQTAYNFASPANRRALGPLEEFSRMVRGRRYRPLIDHEEAVAGPVEYDGDEAEQLVTVTGPGGRTITYAFGLSRAPSGQFEGCWVTDRVLVE
jgi:hypothetical protein